MFVKLKSFMEDFRPNRGSTVSIPMTGVVSQYRERYDALVKDTTRRFRHDVYTLDREGVFIVHVKVPSESIKTEPFYYDVLIQFEPTDGAVSFRDCDVRVFSNCPSYVYSGLGYIHSHWNTEEKGDRRPSMMIDSLKGKLPRENLMVRGTERQLGYKAVHKEPVIRNPMGLPIFDKSLYYAIFYIEDNLTLNQVRTRRHYVTQSQVVASVASFDHLMVERKRAERRERERNNRDKHRNDALFRTNEDDLEGKNGIKKTHRPSGLFRPKQAKSMRTSSALTTKKPKGASQPRTSGRR